MDFFGAHTHRIDAKGRVALPAPFRDQFGDERLCYIIPEPSQQCLAVYTPDGFKVVVERLQAEKRAGRYTQRQITAFMSALVRSSIDSQGRILVPDQLREFANLDKDATLIGVDSHIAIFPADVHSPESALDDLIDISDLL